MRELVFALDYEPGCNEVADTLAAHPEARIRSLSLHATAESLWRVDHVTGPAEARDAVEDAFLTADYYADCLATEDCGASQETQVLDDTGDTLVLYSYWERTPACDSVPHIALDHLGDGLLFETRNEGRRYTWRIVHSGEGDVRAFFDAIEESVGECAELEVERLTEASSPGDAARRGRPAARAGGGAPRGGRTRLLRDAPRGRRRRPRRPTRRPPVHAHLSAATRRGPRGRATRRRRDGRGRTDTAIETVDIALMGDDMGSSRASTRSRTGPTASSARISWPASP